MQTIIKYRKDYIPHTVKLSVVGDRNVGKTSLVQRKTNSKFTDQKQPRSVVDLTLDEVLYPHLTKVQIWDGMPVIRVMTNSGCYRGANGIIICFDVTDKVTFNNLNIYLLEFNRYAKEKTKIILVGTKCDLIQQRQVSFEEAKNFSQTHKIEYFETSSKTGKNVTDAVEYLIHLINEDLLNQPTEKPTPEIRKTTCCIA